MAGVDILASAFSGANAAFLGEQYARWAVNPASVDPTFAELFSALNDDARAVLEDATGASWAPRHPDPEVDEDTHPAATWQRRQPRRLSRVQPRRHSRAQRRRPLQPRRDYSPTSRSARPRSPHCEP